MPAMTNKPVVTNQSLLEHTQFRAEILELILQNIDEPKVFVEKLAEKLLALVGADQIIYHGEGDKRIIVNSEEMQKLGKIPEEYCAQCPYSDVHNNVYKDGYAVVSDGRKGAHGIPVYEKCPVKSSLTRLIFHDGKPYGFLAIHYIKEYHSFTDYEQETFKQLAEIFQNVYSKYVYKEESNKALSAIATMTEDFDYIAAVDEKEMTVTRLWASEKIREVEKHIDPDLPSNKRFDQFIRLVVHPDDLETFLEKSEYNTSIAMLEKQPNYKFEFRTLFNGKEEYYRIKFAYMPENRGIVILGLLNIDQQVRREFEAATLKERAENETRLKEQMARVMELSDDLQAIYDVDLETGRYEVYSFDNRYSDSVLGKLENGENFFADTLKDVETVVFREDRDVIRDTFSNRDYIRQTLAEQGEISIDYRLLVGDEPAWYRVKVVEKPGGEARFLVGIFNIHDRKLREEKRRKTEKESLDIINGLASAYNTIYYIDTDTGEYSVRVVSDKSKFMNDYYSRSVNYEALARNFIDGLVHPEDKDILRKHEKLSYIKKLLKNKKVDTVRFRRKQGDDYIWMEQTYVKTENIDQEAHYVIGAFADRDVMIREEQRKLDIITGLASAYNTLYYVDLDTGEYTAQVVSEKSAFVRDYYSISSKIEPVLKTFIDNVVHPDDREMLHPFEKPAYIRKAMEKAKTETIRFRRKQGDGYIWLELKIVKTEDVDQEARHVVIAFADIDSSVRAEMEQKEALKQALSMAESANRAKTTFLNNMSHDIRTPMNAIIGYTGLAASHIDNRAQVQDYLTKIGESSDHLLSLINDVLDMSRIESGKMNLEEKPESLPDIMHTLRDIVLHDMHEKQHDFFIDTVNVKDESIICDKLRLSQILLNILSNSIKYTPPGGTISMRITEKTVKPSGYATYEFCIKDNGMGMSEEFVKTIFDPFTRVKSSTISGIQGTGLGMAISKNIVEMMGGKIEVQSELGKGTETRVTFDFKLQNVHRESFSIPKLRGFRALVADDDTNTCESIYTMLKEVGMRAEWCTTGKEAVTRAQMAFREGDLFKVYILDWLMPDMNGIETARQIRKSIGEDVPIIVLTAYDWTDIGDEAREAGVTAFISKPVFLSDLHKVLLDCVGVKEEPREEEPVRNDLAGKRILLVEDNEMNREIATELLKEEGMIVETAEDGDIALEKLKAIAEAGDYRYYDAVLMDIQMPRMNGYQATKAIRNISVPDGIRLPIIALSANAFEEDRQKSMEAGMDDHIAKPIDMVKLKNALAKVIPSKGETEK